MTGEFLESDSERDFRSLVLSVSGVWVFEFKSGVKYPLTRFSGIADYICSILLLGVLLNQMSSGQGFCLICCRNESAYCLDEKGGFGLLCSFSLMLVKCLL